MEACRNKTLRQNQNVSRYPISNFRGAATRIVSADFGQVLDKRVRGGTTSFAKRELLRAPQ